MKKFGLLSFLLALIFFLHLASVQEGLALGKENGTKSSQFSIASPPEKPNIILIYCDNLGYGDIEPFGSKFNRTPFLHRMAK